MAGAAIFSRRPTDLLHGLLNFGLQFTGHFLGFFVIGL